MSTYTEWEVTRIFDLIKEYKKEVPRLYLYDKEIIRKSKSNIP